MAQDFSQTFNPGIPDMQIPDYLNNFKPNQTPHILADTSAGTTLSTIGGAIEGATKLADEGIKSAINEDVHNKVDKERSDFTDALTTLKGMVTGGKTNPLDANGQATDQDLMPDQGPAPPQGVNSGLSRIQGLQSAYAGGKVSETQYYGRLNAIAKDLRSTYPGYRDYVDQEISRVTGVNPANAYLKGMIEDINRSTTNTNKEYDYYEKAIMNSGFDHSQQMLQQFQQDRDIPKVQQWMALHNERDSKLKQDAADLQMSDKTRSDLASRAEITANRAAADVSTRFFASRNLLQNDPSSRTSQQISDFLADLALHPEKRDADAIRNVGTQLQMLQSRNYQETQQYLRGLKTKDGQSVFDILGPAKVKQILDTQIGSLYDTQIKLLSDENLGLVHSIQNTVGDLGYNKALDILQDPSTQGFARTGAALGKIWPNMGPELQKEVLGNGPANIGSDLVKAGNQQLKQALSQTGGTVDSGRGKVYTFKQMQGEQDQMQPRVAGTDQDKAAAIGKFLKSGVVALREKDPQILDNAITTFFDPSNRGSLNKLMDDYYDKNRGVVVKGRVGAFSDLTAPDITKNVWNRSQEGHTLGWENYRNWAQGEATAALTTMARTWNKNEDDYAKQTFLQAGANPGMPTRTDHHFYWNTDKGEIGITDVKGNPIDVENSWRVNPDLFAVRNANMVIKSLRTIAQTESSDPKNADAFVFKTLKDAGWSPTNVDQKGNARIDSRIMRAIITGHGGAIEP